MRIFSALSIFFTLTAHAQLITGIVSDQKTNEPLPYVHIGIVGKNMGVISRDDGSYEIDLSKADKTDVLAFSIIGYETRKFNVSDIRPGRMDVKLMLRVYELKEVTVREKDIKPKTEKLGRFTPTKTTMGQSGLREFGFGGEWGLRINAHGKKYFIDDVRLHLRFNTVDSILFRINMYKIDRDMPGESFLQKEVFATSKKKKTWVVRNLQKENLVMDQDLIVTYEVVRVWFGARGQNQLFITAGSGYDEGKTYYRASSQDAWTVEKNPQPKMFPTMYLTVEEF